MNQIQKIIKKTVLTTRQGDKIVVDIPIEVIAEKILTEDILRVGKDHFIKCSAINERKSYNYSSAEEARIHENFPEIRDELMKDMKERKKAGRSVNKEVIANYALEKYKYNKK